MSEQEHGVTPSGSGLSPSVEPVPVSPPDGASIPNADFVSFALHDDEPHARALIRVSEITAFAPGWQDTFAPRGGYPYCKIWLRCGAVIFVLGDEDAVMAAIASASAHGEARNG